MAAPESTASRAPGVTTTMMQLRIFWRRAARIPSAPVNVGCLGFIVIPSVFSVNRFLPVHSYFPLPLPLYFHGFETQNSPETTWSDNSGDTDSELRWSEREAL